MHNNRNISMNSGGYDHNGYTLNRSKINQNVQSKLCGSHRLKIAFLLGMAAFCFYAQRQTLNMNMLCMVDHKGLKNLSVAHAKHIPACKIPLSSPITEEDDSEIINGPYLWDKHVQSIILGSFFWGYVFQLFGGFVAAKVGSKFGLTLAVIVSSGATMLIPLAAKYHYTLVVVLRVLTGVAQGFMYPCCLPLIAKWSPTDERSSLSSFLAAGASLGTIMSTAITGPVCSTGHWYLNFITLAALGFIWLLPWSYYGANTPDDSTHVTVEEITYIKLNSEKTTCSPVSSIRDWPLRSIFTSRSVWVIILTNVLSDFTLYGIFSVFPLYLWEIYNIDIVTNSYISAGEFVFMWLACVFAGIFSDIFIKRGTLSVLGTRKFFNSIGMFMPALLFPIIGYLQCDMYVAMIVLLVLAGGFPGTFMNAGYLLNTVDVSGPYSGIVVGISNSLGSFSGILAPLVANILTKDRTLTQWRLCFIVFSGLLFLAGLIFLFFSKAKLESWACGDEEILDMNEIKTVENATIELRGLNSSKLRRQFSIDKDGMVLVPSNSIIEEYEPYNNVVMVPIHKGQNYKHNVQQF